MFFGREYELDLLKRLLVKQTASLVTCQGRRRIGKSTLFERFAELNGCRFLKIEGLAPRSEGDGQKNEVSDEDQRAAFGRQLAAQTRLPEIVPTSWTQAFQLLDSVITDDRWHVVLLDEISWMGQRAPDFPGELKVAWDNRFKKHDRLILVLCGSVSAWISKNILNNTGFAGRPSVNLYLNALPLCDCVKFWGDTLARRSSREILDILSITGGVPKYLEEIDPSRPVEENVRRLCYSPDGYLYSDFDRIFNVVFGDRAMRKREILMCLADGPGSVSDISRLLCKTRNGHLSEDLEELVLAGFLAADRGLNPQTGKAALSVRYRLQDNYTRFYLKYLLPVKDRIEKRLYDFVSLERLDNWNAVMGLQFENLIVNNYRMLLPRLGLEHAEILSAEPYRRQSGKDRAGCQIDLLIQTAGSVYVVEAKRQRKIGQRAIDELETQIGALGLKKSVSIRTALVYDGELESCVFSKRPYDYLIPASELVFPVNGKESVCV